MRNLHITTPQWKGLPYSECTYENADLVATLTDGPKTVDEYKQREHKIANTFPKDILFARREFGQRQAMTAQPSWLHFGKLRDYQLDGLNWLVLSWLRGNNAILADEMGLGKTIQCVSMMGFLAEETKIPGPFLVVVPLSVIPNWMREFHRWCPQLNTVVYVGDATSREVIRAFEFHTGRASGRAYKFEVLLTTYEVVLKDAEYLRDIRWGYMMVDEAHRLKNRDSSLYQVGCCCGGRRVVVSGVGGVLKCVLGSTLQGSCSTAAGI